jgi:POT family proton-dependent oligopeptide transporter
VGEKVNYRYGLGLAGVGMILGLTQYVLGAKYLGDIGLPPPPNPKARRQALTGAGIIVAAALVIAALSWAGMIHITAEGVDDAVGLFLIVLYTVVFGGLLLSSKWTPVERRRLSAIFVLFVASAMFWSAFEQAGSTLSLFAQRNTRLSFIGFSFPASWFQVLNSLFLVILAPVFAVLWVRLGKKEPTTTTKFSLGLLFVGLGFAVLIPVAGGVAVSPLWLTLTYLLHTIGELCLSPVGLSAMTKLAPQRIAAMIMGVWFLSISVGEFIGGQVASVYEQFPLPVLFGVVALFSILCAVGLTLFIKPMKKLSGGVN